MVIDVNNFSIIVMLPAGKIKPSLNFMVVTKKRPYLLILIKQEKWPLNIRGI